MYSDQITVKLRADWIGVQAPIATGSNRDNLPSTDGENRRNLGETNGPRGTLGNAKSRGGSRQPSPIGELTVWTQHPARVMPLLR